MNAHQQQVIFTHACPSGSAAYLISLSGPPAHALNHQLCMHGAGGATRSYLFVEDVAEAYVCVLHNGITGEVYNIGTQKERTVTAVANDIAKIFKLSAQKIVNVRDRAFNDRRYYICDTKLATLGEPQSLLPLPNPFSMLLPPLHVHAIPPHVLSNCLSYPLPPQHAAWLALGLCRLHALTAAHNPWQYFISSIS